jgi:hypothetical protein
MPDRAKNKGKRLADSIALLPDHHPLKGSGHFKQAIKTKKAVED